jgi:hypothetical protein
MILGAILLNGINSASPMPSEQADADGTWLGKNRIRSHILL